MYDSPRNATVRATSDKMLLYRVDQFTFRYILRTRSSMFREAKKQGGKSVGSFDDEDSPTQPNQEEAGNSYGKQDEIEEFQGDDTRNKDNEYVQYIQNLNEHRTFVRSFMAHPDVSLDSFCLKLKLGEGQFGQVWLAQPKIKEIEKEEFALKIQSQEELTQTSGRSYAKTQELVERECSVMSKLCHPFIVEFVHSFEADGNLYLTMGVIKGKELWDCIHREQDDGEWLSGISEDDAKFYSVLIADTLNYMHRSQICHRDVKPENVMINHSGYPILIDFGFAKVLPDNVAYTLCGTPKCVTPEIIESRGHGCAVDFWALGVLIYKMLSGESPFWYKDIGDKQRMDDICYTAPYPIQNDVEVSEEASDVVMRLLEKDPKNRLVGTNVTSHPWFDAIDLCKARKLEIPAPSVL
jgi:serine/threonine protein kinase